MDAANGVQVSETARIEWKRDAEYVEYEHRTPYSYFHHFYPMGTMKGTLEAMNARAAANSYAAISKGELLRWIGIRLYMTLEPRRGGIPAYWNVGRHPETCALGADVGALAHMTRHRFEQIQQCLSFAPLIDAQLPPDVSSAYRGLYGVLRLTCSA